ncbi:hypothetical protein OHR68_10215 [Spirillospora sp. NBC_00431]
MPYLIVIPAFLVWLVTRRRAVGWVAVGVLGPLMACEPLLLGYDAARWGTNCTELWLLPRTGWQISVWTLGLVPVVLILAATYRPGRRAFRAVSATLALSLVLSVAADGGPPKTVMASQDDCEDVKHIDLADIEALSSTVNKLSTDRRRLAYICSIRGLTGWRPIGSQRLAEGSPLSDAVLLDQGRRVCRGDEPDFPRGLGRYGRSQPSLSQIAFLCPETAFARLRERQRLSAETAAEYKRYRKKATAYCKRAVPDAPRPVRQFTGLVSGGESSSYFLGSGGDGSAFDSALADGLVGAAGGGVTVSTGTEGDLCLTIRAYRKAPPVAVEGWERVTEVGFDSADGQAGIGSFWEPVEAPSLTAAGPGPYRVRVHVRGQGGPERFSPEMPVEHHLIVVFPGKSKKQKTFKKTKG